MLLEMDNKGVVDLANNWSVGGRTRHVDVQYYFFRELKEENVIISEWIGTENNHSDLFTKNLARNLFDKTYCKVLW